MLGMLASITTPLAWIKVGMGMHASLHIKLQHGWQ
jgi:hypothetical protein